MKRTWIVLDVSCLAYRAFHTTGGLEYAGQGTGVLYGLFRDVIALQDRFGSPYLAFCFDAGKPVRSVIYPEYKQRRHHDQDSEDKQRRIVMRKQLLQLREGLLGEIGFRNVFFQEAYEADDMMAAVVEALGPEDRAILVTADQDMWQLLARNVRVFNPVKKELITAKKFTETWGICPSQWVDVKAIAGCSSDNIAGIVGVGEKTAVKYLSGTLKTSTKAYEAITNGSAIWERNLKLVRLPYKGTKKVELQEDQVTEANWRSVLKRFGIKSIRI